MRGAFANRYRSGALQRRVWSFSMAISTPLPRNMSNEPLSPPLGSFTPPDQMLILSSFRHPFAGPRSMRSYGWHTHIVITSRNQRSCLPRAGAAKHLQSGRIKRTRNFLSGLTEGPPSDRKLQAWQSRHSCRMLELLQQSSKLPRHHQGTSRASQGPAPRLYSAVTSVSQDSHRANVV